MPLDMRVFSAIDAKLAEHGLTTEATDDQMREAFKKCVAPQRCLHLAQRMREVRRQNVTDNGEFRVPELREPADALDSLAQGMV